MSDEWRRNMIGPQVHGNISYSIKNVEPTETMSTTVIYHYYVYLRR